MLKSPQFEIEYKFIKIDIEFQRLKKIFNKVKLLKKKFNYKILF